MRRDAFLKLSGLSAHNHKAMVRRELLPWLELEESDDGHRGWSDYKLAQVLETVLALDLAGAGLEQQVASVLVAEESRRIRAWMTFVVPEEGGEPLESDEVWMAVITARSEDGSLRSAAAVQVMPRMFQQPFRFHGRGSAEFTLEAIQHQVENVVMVGVTNAVRKIAQRALAHQIPVRLQDLRLDATGSDRGGDHA